MTKKANELAIKYRAPSRREMQARAIETMQLGMLIRSLGADRLSYYALAGLLLEGLGQSQQQPDVIARWTSRGMSIVGEDP